MLTERLKLTGRWLLWLILAWLVVRGIASVVVPTSPATAPPAGVTAQPAAPSPEAGVHAMLFARQYLTWQRGQPDEHAQRLHPWLPADADPEETVNVRDTEKDQTVRDAWVYRTTPLSSDRVLITVLAEVIARAGDQPDSSRLLLLTVPVLNTPAGPAVYDLPSFVPFAVAAPAQGPALTGQEQPDAGGEVRTLVEAFFKAYAEGADTRFFLLPETRITGFPGGTLTLAAVPGVQVLKTADTTWAMAEVVWQDVPTQAQFRQRYALELVHRDRWLIKDLLQKGV